jgi:hypothetical protein
MYIQEHGPLYPLGFSFNHCLHTDVGRQDYLQGTYIWALIRQQDRATILRKCILYYEYTGRRIKAEHLHL